MDSCFGSTGFPVGTTILSPPPAAPTLAIAGKILPGDGEIERLTNQIKNKAAPPLEKLPPLLKKLPYELLYTIAQMLDPELALLIDALLSKMDRPIYTACDKAYFHLVKQLQEIAKMDVISSVPLLNKQQKGEKLKAIYESAWALLHSSSAKAAGRDLEHDLIQLLLRLPYNFAWENTDKEFSIEDNNAYLQCFDKVVPVGMADPDQLEKIYQQLWGLLETEKILQRNQALVQGIMQLLLRLPYEEHWQTDSEVYTEVTSSAEMLRPFFTHLASIHADKCLRLVIQSVPREIAKSLISSIFPFSIEDKIDNIFIDQAYHHATSPLWGAVLHQREDLVEKLIEMNADVNTCDAHGIPVLAYAASKGCTSIMEKLLACSELDPNIKDNTDCTALYWAAQQNHTEAALLLAADSRIDPNTYSKTYQCSAIHLAVMNGNTALAKRLIQHPQFNPLLKDISGKTARDWAQLKGDEEMTQLLMKIEGRWAQAAV